MPEGVGIRRHSSGVRFLLSYELLPFVSPPFVLLILFPFWSEYMNKETDWQHD
jgi:hypothetical protein